MFECPDNTCDQTQTSANFWNFYSDFKLKAKVN